MTGLYKLVYGTGIYFVRIPPFLPNTNIAQGKSRETKFNTYYLSTIESAEAFSSFLLFFRLEIVKN